MLNALRNTDMSRTTPAPVPTSTGRASPRVNRLSVTAFRNYTSARMDVSSPAIVLTGPNGAGKTNLLEAVSFLTPGRGLRRAKISEVGRAAADGSNAAWAVSAEVGGMIGSVQIGTGRDPGPEGTGRDGGEKRLVRIDGVPAKSQTVLAEHLAVSWLTPQMDRLFIEGSSNRRRFLDRLVYAFDPDHATRVNAYTHALRERARLLRNGTRDPAWFAALEESIAEKAVAIAAARSGLVARLNAVTMAGSGPFPGAELSLDGYVETEIASRPALAVEDELKARLEKARRLDGSEPAAVPGPHRSDLEVRHMTKGMMAPHCSTGEQKALLIAIVLGHARLGAHETGAVPVLLLDEVAAHLDSGRRAALYDILLALGGQVWMTGTDRALFASLEGAGQFFAVEDGEVRAD